MNEISLPKIENRSTINNSNSNNKYLNTFSNFKNRLNQSKSTILKNQKYFNKTFKKLFDNPLATCQSQETIGKKSSDDDILNNINFIKNPSIDMEIERLQERTINDKIFTDAVRNFSFDKRKEGLIRGVNRKRTIYGIDLQSDKLKKKESFKFKNDFPLYFPNITHRNMGNENTNKHYSRNIIKILNNKIFSQLSQDNTMKPWENLDFDSFDKKFEEEVKNYQLSKIVKMNNLNQNNDNLIMINSVEDIGNKHFEENIGYGQLFYVRENNFNENEMNQKLENYKFKTDLKEKTKDLNIFNKTKVKKKKSKDTYSYLFNKKDIKKSKGINNNEQQIVKYELKIYYCQNLSTSNKTKDGIEGINQDSFLQLLSMYGNPKFHLFGVMDGHGINGHLISKYISRFVIEYFISDKNKKLFNNCKNNKEIYDILTRKKYFFINRLIYECNNSLINNTNYECNLSGSTCLLLFIIGKKIICANIGDGRAIILEKTELLQLSVEQNLKDPEELKRILNKGGKVKIVKNKIIADINGCDNFEISRSIGDKFLKNIGIIYQPVITEYKLSKNSRFIIMGTKGLWKGISNEKACMQVNKSIKLDNPLDSCRLLEKKAEENIFKNASYRDDMTSIVIIFEQSEKDAKNVVYE